MSLPSRFAGSITASFIGQKMRPLGGSSSTSIHFQSPSGSGSIVRPIASTPGRNCKADQRRCRCGRDREAGLLLSVYVPSISGLLHRPKAAAGRWKVVEHDVDGGVHVLVSDSEVRTRVCCKGLRTSGSGHWRRVLDDVDNRKPQRRPNERLVPRHHGPKNPSRRQEGI